MYKKKDSSCYIYSPEKKRKVFKVRKENPIRAQKSLQGISKMKPETATWKIIQTEMPRANKGKLWVGYHRVTRQLKK